MQNRLRWAGALAGASFLVITSGCGLKAEYDRYVRNAERKLLSERVDSIRNGDLFSEASQTTYGKEGDNQGTATDDDADSENEAQAPAAPEAVATAVAPEPDPCPEVPKVTTELHEDYKGALKVFGQCLTKIIKPAQTLLDVIHYLKLIRPNLAPGETKLSERSIEELDDFLKVSVAHSDQIKANLGSPMYEAELRTSYSDDELEEIVSLIRRANNRLRDAEKKAFAAVDANLNLVKYFAENQKNNRYAALLALKNTANDRLGKKTLRALKAAFVSTHTHFEVPVEITTPPSVIGLGLIHPYALMAVLPDPDKEDHPLHPILENPFQRVKHAIGGLAGPPALVDNAVNLYAIARDQVRPALPDHPPAAPNAVRVAFIDTGVDFQLQKDLGLFLGDGTQGQLSSMDMGGTSGNNPWAPMPVDVFSHGSLTMASLLTLIAQQSPDMLKNRELDLAMWKFRSEAVLLSGAIGRDSAWHNTLTNQHYLMKKIEAAETKPHIVSVSMGFGMWKHLQAANKKDLVKNAPWLWVISSGNEGRNLDTDWSPDEDGDDSVCLHDIPPEHKDASKIMYVGALIQGIVQPKLADYSNYGKRVDVYAFESYTKLCPNGTSCAAPAVSAAAAMILNRFPTLTASQLKEVIVEAAEEQEVQVGLSNPKAGIGHKVAGRLGSTIKVKVFSPVGMLDKAMKIAATKVR